MTQPVDPERPRGDRPFDRPTGYSGQEADIADEAALREPDRVGTTEPGDLPPEAGDAARVDRRTGEVHGSGTGIGGGSPGEDYDSSGASGDSYPLTGGERSGEQA